MLLAFDVGNTQTVVGLYESGESGTGGLQASDGLVDHWRVATEAERTADEHAVLIGDTGAPQAFLV